MEINLNWNTGICAKKIYSRYFSYTEQKDQKLIETKAKYQTLCTYELKKTKFTLDLLSFFEIHFIFEGVYNTIMLVAVLHLHSHRAVYKWQKYGFHVVYKYEKKNRGKKQIMGGLLMNEVHAPKQGYQWHQKGHVSAKNFKKSTCFKHIDTSSECFWV